MSGTRVIPKPKTGTGTTGVSSHNTLSSVHLDTTAATLERGDILVVDSTSKLTRFPKGAEDAILTMGASDPYWNSTLTFSYLDLSSADYSVPFPVSTGTAPTTEGWTYYNATTHRLTIGDGTTAENVLIAPALGTQGSILMSGATDPYWATTLTLTALDVANAEYSIPMKISTETAPTTIGYTYLNSSTGDLSYGFNGAAQTIATANNTITLTNKSIQFQNSPAAGAGKGLIIPGTLGGNANSGEVVYYKSDSLWYKALASTVTTMPGEALVLDSGITNTSVNLLLHGTYTFSASRGFSIGSLLYVDRATAGLITHTIASHTTAGDQIQIVGFALSNSTIVFNPNLMLIEVA